MENKKLSTLLLSYREGKLAKSDMVEAVSIFVYKFPSRVYKWKEDECSDFFSFFYPKIEKIIDTFQIRGIPFEAYLIKTLKMQIKTFAAKKIAEQVSERVMRNREFWPYDRIIEASSCLEHHDDYCKTPGPAAEMVNQILASCDGQAARNSTLKKRITMLILKNIKQAEQEDLDQLASVLGCSSIWIKEAIGMLRERVGLKIRKRQEMEQRRNRHFYRLCVLHEHFYCCQEKETRENIYADIQKTKLLIENISKRIDQISEEPTHQDIADIMQLPKGSVDSGLFYLKLYLDNI